MKLIWLLLLLIVLQISIVAALPLEVQPSSISINMTKGVEKTILVNITNPNDYSLYKIKAKGDVVVNPNEELLSVLNPGDSVLVDVDVRATEVGDLTRTIRFESFERAGCSTPIHHEIIISDSGPVPKDLSICISDSLKYTNNYSTPVDIDFSNFNDFNQLATGGSVDTGPFSNEGTYLYMVIPVDMMTWGIITVSSDLGDVYDPENDGILILNIYSFLEETTISLNFLKTSFTMSYNSEKQNMFSISNTGSKTAENIHVSGDWFVFDNNDISLDPDAVVGINFKIVPSAFQLFETSDTDKQYTKTISISGDNIVSVTQDIKIFIEYSDVESTNVSSYAWWQAKKEFCDTYPDSSLCISEPRIVEVFVANDSIPVEFNMTGKTLKEYLDEVRGVKALFEGYNNNWKLDTSNMKIGISSNTNRTETILANQIENEKRANGFRGTFYLIFGTFMFIIIGGIVGYVLYKYYLRNISRREGTI